MAGKFEVYKDRAGKYRFRLKERSGRVVATGEAYATRAEAMKACESLQRVAADAELAVASAGQPGSGGFVDAAVGQEETPVASGGDAEDQPRSGTRTTRRFRFSGGMAAEPDLAERSGDILREEIGRPK